jgi:hypothetical protein
MPFSQINLQHLLREIDSLKRRLPSGASLDDNLCWPHFRLEWNYQTALLCGLSVNRVETALLQQDETVQGMEKAASMICGHDAAIHQVKALSAEKGLMLDMDDVKALQQLILGAPCNWRQADQPVPLSANDVYHPVSPESIPDQLDELLGWCQRYAFDTHPVLLAAEWYLGIIRIQPFETGNGRLARLLMNFHLLRHGYPPVIFTEETKEQFQEALAAALEDEEAELAGYVARKLILSLDWVLDRLREHAFSNSTDWETALSNLERQLPPPPTMAKRSADFIRQRLQDSLLPLIELTLLKTNRIDRLYAESQYALHAYFDGHLEKTDPGNCRLFFNSRDIDSLERLQEMDLILRWSSARYHNALGYDLSLNLQFRFGQQQYDIIGPEYQIITSKSYDLPLLHAEQDLVMEEIGKFLLEKLKS